MASDPIINEVRRIRDELAAKHGYDIHRIMADARLRQRKYASKLVTVEESRNRVDVNSVKTTR